MNNLIKHCKNVQIDEAKKCIIAGENINQKDGSGRTPLCWCSFATYETDPRLILVTLLLENGADPNIGYKGYTPLMHCTQGTLAPIRSLEIADKLYEFGANVDLTDKDGNTALIYSATTVSVEGVRWLLNHKANTTIADKHGFTALDHVKSYLANLNKKNEHLRAGIMDIIGLLE